MRDSECVETLQWLLPRLQMRWQGFRKVRRQACRRIERRLRELELPDAASYRAYLQTHDDEWAVVDRFCRISISRFYRDRGVFDALRDAVLPELAALARARGDSALRCWSAGCASGEEVYSLTIVWNLCLAARFPDLALRVVGVDSDPTMIDRARRGCYEYSSLKDLPRQYLDAAFDQQDGLYRVREEHRVGVEFQLQDIRREMPDGPFHLILCRHVAFTYFDESLQRTTLTGMLQRLIPGGVLATGKQEPLPPGVGGLTEYGKRMGIYRRISDDDALAHGGLREGSLGAS